MVVNAVTSKFKYVQEWNDEFLTLFPHRFDYIWAEHPDPNAEVKWKTESRHPLGDRLIRQGAYLYGVRFGAQTNYGLLDIDRDSLYHPQQDPLAIARIVAALEPLGLVSYLVCTSSYSGGLHLYLPFQQSQSSWQLAIALACLLENAGFKLQPGHLEVFPNPKPYLPEGNLSLFNAHRLPLQIGSYLLDKAFQRIWSDSHTFVQQWRLAQQRNDIDQAALKRILKQAKRKHFGISGKAEKFLNDLNAEIELGWTGYGQTNRLLGRITMRAYIFQHVLSGGKPLAGQALVNEIVETATSLPGYQDWCQHQHEIEHRAEEWARCIEGSHYYHFGDHSKKQSLIAQDPNLIEAIEQSPSWNQRQSAATRDRIRQAIAHLLETGQLPAKPTARFQSLLKYGIGGGSLYRHRDLWHPNYFEMDTEAPVENPPHPPSIKTGSQLEQLAPSNWHSPPSLFPSSDGDNPPCLDSSHSVLIQPLTADSNFSVQLDRPSPSPFEQQELFNFTASQAAFQEANRMTQAQRQQIKEQAAVQRRINRMQEYLDSGDPILMAEALAWARINPGVLKLTPLQLSLLTEEAHDHSHNHPSGDRLG